MAYLPQRSRQGVLIVISDSTNSDVHAVCARVVADAAEAFHLMRSLCTGDAVHVLAADWDVHVVRQSHQSVVCVVRRPAVLSPCVDADKGVIRPSIGTTADAAYYVAWSGCADGAPVAIHIAQGA